MTDTSHSPGRLALVTGATRGIGRAVVRQMTARGLRVFATGRDSSLLATLREETGCHVMACDLALPDAPESVYAAACAAFNAAPDILVNNAGFNRRKSPVAEITGAELDAHYAVNLRAAVLLCAAAMRDMGPRKSGHIINVASTMVWHQAENTGVYSAMKCALHGFTMALAKEARLAGVKVTCAYPGGTDTGFRAAERPDYLRPESVARMLVDVLFAPDDVVVHQLTFRPMVESNF